MPLRFIDPEVATVLAGDALEALDELLAAQQPSDRIQFRKIGALVRLVCACQRYASTDELAVTRERF